MLWRLLLPVNCTSCRECANTWHTYTPPEEHGTSQESAGEGEPGG